MLLKACANTSYNFKSHDTKKVPSRCPLKLLDFFDNLHITALHALKTFYPSGDFSIVDTSETLASSCVINTTTGTNGGRLALGHGCSRNRD